MEQTNNSVGKFVAVGAICFLIGFGLSWAIFTRQARRSGERSPAAEESAMNKEENRSGDSRQGAGGASAIEADNQPAGSRVLIRAAALAQPGWIAVHEDNNGTPGKILGAARVDAGEYANGSVDLLRPTESGKAYYAMVHGDDGDKQFDHTKDLPVTDQSGNPVTVRFSTTQ